MGAISNFSVRSVLFSMDDPDIENRQKPSQGHDPCLRPKSGAFSIQLELAHFGFRKSTRLSLKYYSALFDLGVRKL